MKQFLQIFSIIFYLVCVSDAAEKDISVIPYPAQVAANEGEFTINSDTIIVSPESLKLRAKQIQRLIEPATGYQLATSSKTNGRPCIELKLNPSLSKLGNEGYQLSVSPSKILIQATESSGIFYGIQTLRQLLPAEIVSKTKVNNIDWTIPCLEISDTPRFAWRAFMLDEARNFHGEEQVKILLDQMSNFKLNVFHWHLVDDQGWRIEIKKYPKLTEVGGQRPDTQIGGWVSKKRTGEPHKGFYTQEQIKEIVKYAADRNITIVPEIEMPGHASASIAAYPWLGSIDEKIEVPVTFGKKKGCYNIADPKVYQALTDILDEVIALFPGDVIHIGGDEVNYSHWNKNDQIKAYKEKHGLKNMQEVQVHFTNRMSKTLASKNRRMMGWNEILGVNEKALKNGEQRDVELSKNAIVHFWKGSSGLAKEAIKQGYDVVNSWHEYTYLDYGYGKISLKKAYEFDPIFEGLEPKHHDKIIGFGCQMWGEWIHTLDRLENKVYPRISAYAEAGWTPLTQKNYLRYVKAMKNQWKRWDIEGLRYPKHLSIVKFTQSDFDDYQTIGNWDPSQVDADKWQDIEFDITKNIKTPGQYNVAFVYTKGGHAAEIKNVALLENGNAISHDNHEAFSGNRLNSVVYELKIRQPKAGAKYTIKAEIKGNTGNDSNGKVMIAPQS